MTSPLLTRTKMSDAGVLPRRSTSSDQRVKLADPAINVMNDFAHEYPVTVDEDRQIDAALADMIRLGVRALLVVRERKVMGLITSYDIEGERPLQCMQRLSYSYRQDIQVSHVMTPWTELQTLSWRADLRWLARRVRGQGTHAHGASGLERRVRQGQHAHARRLLWRHVGGPDDPPA